MNDHFQSIEGKISRMDDRLNKIEDDVAKVKLAVLDYPATDRAVHNLVRELKAQGIDINEARVFST